MNLSRRRYQKGELKDEGDRWTLRWREDQLDPSTGQVRRVRKWDVLSKKDFPTKRLAQRALDDKLREVNSESYRPTASGVTFSAFAQKWQKEVMCHFKPSAQDGAKSIIKVHLIPAFGQCTLKQITAESIQEFVNGWKAHPKSLSNAIRQMRGMWDVATAWGYATHNPFPRGVSGTSLLRMPSIPKPKTYNFTLEETLAIIAKAEGKWRLLFRTLAEAGMRPGELSGMRKTDLAGRVINLSQSVYRGKIQTQKTENAVRQFSISQDLADELREYMASTEGEKNNFNLVWTNGEGNPIAMNKVLANVLNPILEELGIRQKLEAMGIKACGNYAFRHMNITELRRHNVPLKTIQKRVGHAQGSGVTDGSYVHSVDADDLAAADMLGALLAPKKDDEAIQ